MTQTPLPTYETVIAQLQALANAENVAGQQRFAITGGIQLGVSLYDLRKLAKGVRSHELAAQLWASHIHEARILAALVDDPAQVTLAQMEQWAGEFESWDVCDEVTDELFIHTPFILQVIPAWAAREEEFVRRAAFASIAALVVHRKDIPDETVRTFFPLIEAAADDARNFVWKAVNWALRNTAKFRPELRAESVACAKRILKRDIPAARKIARDALKEFELKFGADFVASVQEGV
jgi:3-methyladenine DNA glycosylase AlkD